MIADKVRFYIDKGDDDRQPGVDVWETEKKKQRMGIVGMQTKRKLQGHGGRRSEMARRGGRTKSS